MTFTLRPATNSDRAAIESLVFGVLAEYGLAPDPNGTDADLQDIETEYGRKGGMFDVLMNENGLIVGSVALHATSGSTCEIRKMYLASSARGKGLGRRLLEHALAEAKSLGFGRVELETASVLKEAIALYESYGFRKFCASHLSSRCDSAYYVNVT
jgi:putative acetyltransferase